MNQGADRLMAPRSRAFEPEPDCKGKPWDTGKHVVAAEGMHPSADGSVATCVVTCKRGCGLVEVVQMDKAGATKGLLS